MSSLSMARDVDKTISMTVSTEQDGLLLALISRALGITEKTLLKRSPQPGQKDQSVSDPR